MKGRVGISKRQRSALSLLEAQLASGSKSEKVEGRTTNKQIELSDGDKNRMKREIETLKKLV